MSSEDSTAYKSQPTNILPIPRAASNSTIVAIREDTATHTPELQLQPAWILWKLHLDIPPPSNISSSSSPSFYKYRSVYPPCDAARLGVDYSSGMTRALRFVRALPSVWRAVYTRREIRGRGAQSDVLVSVRCSLLHTPVNGLT